jgi:hypothetical protein
MPKVSVKVQRRIAELDAEYIVAKSKSPGRHALAVIVLAIIAVAAYSSAHRDTPGFSRLTLKQDASAPKRQMSDSEVQTEWNAVLGAASAGLKSGE